MKTLKSYIEKSFNITESEQVKVNIVIGRFQPFTLGHLKCCEQTYIKTGLPTVLLVVDTKKADEKHPFLSSILMPYLEKLKDCPCIKDIILVKNADIVVNSQACQERGYLVSAFTCGTDRYKQYKKMSERYKEQAGLSEDFQMIEIERSDEDISATKVRNAIKEDDKKTFEELTPKCFHPAYAKLRKELLKNG